MTFGFAYYQPDKFHILKGFFLSFAYSEPERSDIYGYQIKIELFPEITNFLTFPL